MIPFNKPFIAGNELRYIEEAVNTGKISGDGLFTKRCHEFFEQRFGFQKCLLTTSCTDALEMAAILIDTKEGDEIIMPSYTFVSTANAFVLRGAKLIFCDSTDRNPNMDAASLESLITPRTKAIVVVHYGGVACDMDTVLEVAKKHNLFVIEDAAQAIDAYYKGRALGSIGHLAAFSFHETKNIISGEGGMLVINDPRFNDRAEVIREKGTNRSQFFRGEVDKYGWVDIGSSFLPSEIIAAFLFGQLENLDKIQERRIEIWQRYHEAFAVLEERGLAQRPVVPEYATVNGHLYYLMLPDLDTRQRLIAHLKGQNILSVFHYLSLHHSKFYRDQHDGRELPCSDHYTERLLRLPLFYTLQPEEQSKVINSIMEFFA
jgi:dTDP-4-amino-4,6-dideoxygalactose transaminase